MNTTSNEELSKTNVKGIDLLQLLKKLLESHHLNFHFYSEKQLNELNKFY